MPPPVAPWQPPPVAEAPPEPEPEWPPPPPPPPEPEREPDFDAGTVLREEGRDGGTLNGDPNGPRPEDLRAALDGALPGIKSCFDVPAIRDGTDVSVQIAYQVEPTGQAREVAVSGDVPAKVQACLQGVVEGIAFPKFGGPAVRSSVPVKFRRDPK